MRIHSRARRAALAALFAGGSIGAVGLVAAPGQALAATSCSNVFASGSTLQTKLQQNTFTLDAGPDGAFTSACTSTPSIYYNTNGAPPFNEAGTGSGLGLTEFALQAPAGGSAAVTPSDSSNGSWLDGFIGTDDPPSSPAMYTASSAASSDPEPVPVVDAPVAIVVHLPSGCTISHQPIFRNADLSKAFANTSTDNIDWNTLLTDAGAGPSGCSPTAHPIVQVRSDGSGTAYALKQYLSQIDWTTWAAYVSDADSWPGTTSNTYQNASGTTVNDQGSSGEAAAVAATAGSIGYVNTADAAAAGFADWSTSSGATFWTEVQNNGSATTGTLIGANPDTSSHAGNCPTSYSGTTVPPYTASEPDWTGVHLANPSTSSHYPLCTLTYDVAWQHYSGSSVLSSLYNAKYTGESASGVAAATKAYLLWEVSGGSGKGQSVIPSYYSALPSRIETTAAEIVHNEIGLD